MLGLLSRCGEHIYETYGQEDGLRNLRYSREVAENGEINELCPQVN